MPALGFLLAAALAEFTHATMGWAPGHWLALHLAFVGGISQLVLGAGQFFAGAFLATAPPPRALLRVQALAWSVGVLLVAYGVPGRSEPAVLAGAALLAVGILGFVAGLLDMRRRSLQRVPWAVRWYEACALFLGLGVVVGALLASGVRLTAGSLLGAHMALNLAGWFGTAIVGTLHTFFPSLTQTPLRFPQLQRPTFVAWIVGTVMLAAGYAAGTGLVVMTGWAALAAAAGLLGGNLLASLRIAPQPLSLPARLVAAGQLCLLLGVLAGWSSAARHGAMSALPGTDRDVLAALLLPGWLGLTVAGSLLQLLAVLGRVRDLHCPLPKARPGPDTVLVALAITGVLVFAGTANGRLSPLHSGATAIVLIVYCVLSGRIAVRAFRALQRRPSRIAAP